MLNIVLVFLIAILLIASSVFYIRYIGGVIDVCVKLNSLSGLEAGCLSQFKGAFWYFVISNPQFTHLIIRGRFNGISDFAILGNLKVARSDYLSSIVLFFGFILALVYKLHFA